MRPLIALSALICPAVFASGAAAKPPAEGARTGAIYQTRVLLSDDCLIYRTGVARTDRGAGLFAGPLMSIVSPLITSGIDLITAHFQRIKEEFSASESALGAGLFYDTRNSNAPSLPRNYCLTIVRGAFSRNSDPQSISTWTRELGAALNREVDPAGAMAIGLAARPDFYAEFHLRYSENPGAFEILPKVIDFHKPLAKRSGAKGKLVTIGFRFDAVAPGSGDATFASGAMPAMRLFPGAVYGPDTLDGVTSGFLAAPAQASIAVGNGVTTPSATPFNLIVSLCEAEEPSVLAKLLANSAAAMGEGLKDDLIAAAASVIEEDKKKTKD